MAATSKVIPFRPVKGPAPTRENGKVLPLRVKNSEVRTREYLTADEIERLITSAKSLGRYGLRDAALILLAYRHGLRVGELVDLKWEQFDFKRGEAHINRMKNGSPAIHPVEGDELRSLRRLKLKYPDSPFVFTSERGAPLTTSAVRKIVARAGESAKIGFPVHPHMLRHSCGHYLANRGIDTRSIQAYLGHRSIEHTVRYTELLPDRFKGFWKH